MMPANPRKVLKGRQIMKSDMGLQRDILDEILWEPSVHAPDIGVIVHDGIVTLTGSVDNLPAKWGAEKAALRVSGVKAVANDIEVKLSTNHHRSDEDIATAATDVLEWNVFLPKHLQAVVQDGWVTLTGKVQWQFQKNAAGDLVEWLTGVRGVTNNITVRPHITPFAIQGKIEAALQRHAALDSKGIQVKTEDGKVILEGTVGSWAEREGAENVAWSAPGVTLVENKLSIQNRKS
jgi:osmotically-inducible protein OsmY